MRSESVASVGVSSMLRNRVYGFGPRIGGSYNDILGACLAVRSDLRRRLLLCGL